MGTGDHTPVLVEEVLDLFQPGGDSVLLDATVGLGGHSAAFLERAGPESRVVGADADPAALAEAKERLAQYDDRVQLIHGTFAFLTHSINSGSAGEKNHETKNAQGEESDKNPEPAEGLKDSLQGGGIVQDPPQFTHILFDLGVGSHQLADATRGFSFREGEGLEMRYGDTELPASALHNLNKLTERLGRYPDVPDLLQYLSADALAEVIKEFGEERYAARIAEAIAQKSFASASELARTVTDAVRGPATRIHPATRTFQALRLAVNRELESIALGLPQAYELLAPGGVLAVISFHSLEDRITKRFFKEMGAKCTCPPEQLQCTCTRTPRMEILTKKPTVAGTNELEHNPRSRSAKLRAGRKL